MHNVALLSLETTKNIPAACSEKQLPFALDHFFGIVGQLLEMAMASVLVVVVSYLKNVNY